LRIEFGVTGQDESPTQSYISFVRRPRRWALSVDVVYAGFVDEDCPQFAHRNANPAPSPSILRSVPSGAGSPFDHVLIDVRDGVQQPGGLGSFNSVERHPGFMPTGSLTVDLPTRR